MPDTPPPDGLLLTLQEAADRLKVHYMTAYRWVRKGQELPAFKAGGRLRVRASELERFLLDRQADVALPAGSPRRTRWAAHVDRLHRLLLDGRAVDAAGLLRKVVSDGAPAGDVYLSLLAPALHRVGEDWAAGRIGVAAEHRATEITAVAMARLGDHFRRRGPSRGVAVTLTPPGEQHGLGSAMAADFMRAAGYDVHHLGVNVPTGELRQFLSVVACDVICSSVTTPGLDPGYYRELVSVSRDGGPPAVVVIGGQGADPEAARDAGALHVADLRDLSLRLDAMARS